LHQQPCLPYDESRVCVPTKVRVYQTLVLPILTYACKTWTLLAANITSLEAFHMKCQRQIAKIDLLAGPCVEHRRFLSDRSGPCAGSNRPSLQLTLWTCSQTSRGHTCPPSHIDLSLGGLPDPSWRRCPPRPLNGWLDLLRGDRWRRAVTRGHFRVTLRSSRTMC